MAKIDTIENIANSISKSNIAVEYERCINLRNVHAKCNLCKNTCPQAAIEVDFGHFQIKNTICTNCASCVSACPTSALSCINPNRNEIVKKAKKFADKSGGLVLFVCSMIAKEYNIDTQKCLVIPCLNYIDEYLICGLKALGVEQLGLICAKNDDSYLCYNCEMLVKADWLGQKKSNENVTANLQFLSVVQRSKVLLDLWNIKMELVIFDYVPISLKKINNDGSKSKEKKSKEKQANATYNASRRESFEQAGRDAATFVTSKVSTLFDENKKSSDVISVDASVKIEDGKTLSSKLLNLLPAIGQIEEDKTIKTKFWASINIDESLCNYCGDCGFACPTNALKYNRSENSIKGRLEFNASLCCNCKLCAQACYKKAIIIDNAIMANNLISKKINILFEEAPKL
ncbi:MAG: 4Fe-4S binding protein [Coriobacteriales bacterium]|nr:4Fe-4S binding protein [Coriobacteriales bacterium]